VAGAALAAKALYGIGSPFSDLRTKIATSTGASGKDLDGLVGAAKRVASKVLA
jgi:hypothetical protein